jgi:hypothetical protein
MVTRVPPRRQRVPGRVTFQEPLIDKSAKPPAAKPEKSQPEEADKPAPARKSPVAEKSDRPADHKGISIVREELRSFLPNGAPTKISKLHLSDGTAAFACRDCLFTHDTIAGIQHHRNDLHGTTYGHKAPRVIFEKDATKPVGDLVLPPRGDRPAPTNPMEMTLAEFLALVPSYAALADLIDRLERERDSALEKVIEIRSETRDAQHALAVYPSLQEEVVDLRMKLKGVGSFDEMKAELLALRAWKKKMIQRLEPLGFALIDEDTTTSKEQ